MTDGWVETTLGEVASLTIGRTPPRKDSRFWTDDLALPFCTIADMDGWSLNPAREGVTPLAEAEGKAKRVPAGSLLMSFKLTIGRVGFAARDVFPNEAIVWIDPSTTDLDVRYLAYWLDAQDLSQGSGRAVKGSTLNSASLRSIRVAFPPLAVQRRIVDLMGHVDTHLANLETERDAVAALVESLREELLAPQIGWTRATLGELTTKIGSGATPRGGEGSYKTRGVSLIRSQNVHDGAFVSKGLARIDMEQARALEGVTVESDDCLTNITGASVNRTCVVPDEVLPARVNQHVAIVRPSPGKATGQFISQSLRRRDVRRLMDRMATAGTTRQAITKGQLAALVIDVPEDVVEQVAIVTTLRNAESQIRSLASEVLALRSVRGGILSNLLAGAALIPESYDELLGVG